MPAEVYYHDMAEATSTDIDGQPFDMYVRMAEEPHIPEEVFEEMYTHVGTDGDAEDLANLFERWNLGSRRECEEFIERECLDCEETFSAPVDRRGRQIGVQQSFVDTHEEETGHTVEEGNRSMSVGDIGVVDGEAYLVCPIGWERQPHLDGIGK